MRDYFGDSFKVSLICYPLETALICKQTGRPLTARVFRGVVSGTAARTGYLGIYFTTVDLLEATGMSRFVASSLATTTAVVATNPLWYGKVLRQTGTACREAARAVFRNPSRGMFWALLSSIEFALKVPIYRKLRESSWSLAAATIVAQVAIVPFYPIHVIRDNLRVSGAFPPINRMFSGYLLYFTKAMLSSLLLYYFLEKRDGKF